MRKFLTGRHAALLTGGVAAGSSLIYSSAFGSSDRKIRPYHPSLDSHAFTPWRLTHKQAISTTNAIFGLSPSLQQTTAQKAPPDQQGVTNPYGKLWENGTWSITIKQPQLQVAREYTPLPPFPHPFFVPHKRDEQELLTQSGYRLEGQNVVGETTSVQQLANNLRFLIRKDGETSSYVHQRTVEGADGSKIEVRGPSRELEGYGIGQGQAQEIVFVAGGTGIAPAMQLAYGVLARQASAYQAVGPSAIWPTEEKEQAQSHNKLTMVIPQSFPRWPAIGDEPRISILWANRTRQECHGGQTDTSLTLPTRTWKHWFSTSQPASSVAVGDLLPTTNPIVLQLRSLQRSFKLVSVMHTIGADNSSLEAKDVSEQESQDVERTRAGPISAAQALEDVSPAGPKLEIAYFVDEEGTFISKAHLKHVLNRPPLPGHESAPRGGEAQKKRKLVIVSGPDGFVEYFAGARDIVNGRVAQGRVGGILGELKREGLLGGWEVVKL
ncbi:Hypothetical protein D9617_1g085270 [Elsinoe fawcettii]|nr:Hypothetical protein D9617_1g085270 [Elsinoe fawcettii]